MCVWVGVCACVCGPPGHSTEVQVRALVGASRPANDKQREPAGDLAGCRQTGWGESRREVSSLPGIAGLVGCYQYLSLAPIITPHFLHSPFPSPPFRPPPMQPPPPPTPAAAEHPCGQTHTTGFSGYRWTPRHVCGSAGRGGGRCSYPGCIWVRDEN